MPVWSLQVDENSFYLHLKLTRTSTVVGSAMLNLSQYTLLNREPITHLTVTDCKCICHVIKNLVKAGMLSYPWGEVAQEKQIPTVNASYCFTVDKSNFKCSSPAPCNSSATSTHKLLTSTVPSLLFEA